jgi:ribosomal protein S12 methylthiotransferase accessory factor YcaO
LTFIAGARDDLYWNTYQKDLPLDSPSGKLWLSKADREKPVVNYREIIDPISSEVKAREALDYIVQSISRNGFKKVLRVDLTSPELGVPVVHIFVPGLEPVIHGKEYSPGARMAEHIRDAYE